ncbi:SH3 domain-containing protein [Streptomyces sp. NPDC047123]|uniref:SH3 domain-containing protein n=1 Tax=Streptomyces sp. NPDC047123 TaxID=3155622 RepID=UPI0033E6F33E
MDDGVVIRRHELSDAEWEFVRPLLPASVRDGTTSASSYAARLTPGTFGAIHKPAEAFGSPRARYRGTVIARSGLLIRDRPTTAGRAIGSLPRGKIVTIRCKVKGERINGNHRWYVLTNGTYAYSSARYIANIGTPPPWC